MFGLTLPHRRSRKYGWLPGWARVTCEKVVHPHVPVERAELFEAYNAGTTELELLNWLHATVLLLKPRAVLETGAADGLGTIALARACSHNGFGTVHSVEVDPACCLQLRKRLDAEGLLDFVQIHCRDSRDFLSTNKVVFDFAFFDSMCEIRAAEFRICLDKGTVRQLAVFHDTSPLRCDSLKGWPSNELHTQYRLDLEAFRSDPRCTGYFESHLSRGFVCVCLK